MRPERVRDSEEGLEIQIMKSEGKTVSSSPSGTCSGMSSSSESESESKLESASELSSGKSSNLVVAVWMAAGSTISPDLRSTNCIVGRNFHAEKSSDGESPKQCCGRWFHKYMA